MTLWVLYQDEVAHGARQLSVLTPEQRQRFIVNASRDLELALQRSETITGANIHEAANLRLVLAGMRKAVEDGEADAILKLVEINDRALDFLKRLLEERARPRE